MEDSEVVTIKIESTASAEVSMKPQGSQGQKYEGRDYTIMSDSEIAPTGDNVPTVSDDKATEGGNKPVCDEVGMEDVAGTIFEEVVVRAAEKVEDHIPLAEGHEEVLLRN